MRTDTQGRARRARMRWVMGLSTAAAVALAACSAARTNTGAATSAAATPAIEATIVATEAPPTDAATPTTQTATTDAATPTTQTTTTDAATPTTQSEQAPTPNASLKPALQAFVSGLEKPTYLTFSGAGDELLYVTEQPGRVRVIQSGALVETPFLDITDRVGSGGNEQGLLSVVFPPDFAQSRKLYVNYTDKDGNTHVAGFVAAADGLSADPASEWTVITIDQPYANHNGGQLKFGPDGMLYVGMGDGGSAGDPQNRAQNPDELLGKMLRLDVTQSTADAPYTVPAGNATIGKPEIWAWGLRNPWRFSFDRSTGDLFMADVGQNAVEEVNFQPANSASGVNFGWRLREGRDPYSDGGEGENLVDPVWQYQHGDDGCSVTGGYVYRGPTLGALSGAYIYGDYCSGRVWALRSSADGQWTNDVLFETGYSITSFGEDAQGELYVLSRDGTIYKLAGE